MSISFYCKCEERKKPIEERNWEIIDYKCNYSTFNGCRYTPSIYSCIRCLNCRACGRTKAKYVATLFALKKFSDACAESPNYQKYLAKIREDQNAG